MNRSEILAKRLLEAEPEAPPPPSDEPKQPLKLDTRQDVKGEIDKLLPTRTIRLKGSTFWNAAGMLNLALRPFLVGTGRADQKWGLNVMRAMNIPEDLIDHLINGRGDIRAEGDDAVVTIQLYGDKPRNRKGSRRPAQGQ